MARYNLSKFNFTNFNIEDTEEITQLSGESSTSTLSSAEVSAIITLNNSSLTDIQASAELKINAYMSATSLTNTQANIKPDTLVSLESASLTNTKAGVELKIDDYMSATSLTIIQANVKLDSPRYISPTSITNITANNNLKTENLISGTSLIHTEAQAIMYGFDITVPAILGGQSLSNIETDGLLNTEINIAAKLSVNTASFAKLEPESILTEIRKILRSKNYKTNIYAIGRGLIDISPAKDTYQDGEKIQLSASSHDKWDFIKWHNIEDKKSNNCHITLDSDYDGEDIIAEFRPDFNLEVRGQGTAEASLDDDKSVFPGHYLNLEAANPGTGFYFAGWSDNVANKDKKETEIEVFSIDKTNYKGQGVAIPPGPANRSYSSFLIDNIENYRITSSATAYFERIKYYLDIDIIGNGTVNITPEEDYYTYDYGQVMISTSPAQDWKFYEFRGDTDNFERQNNSFITYFDEEVDEENYTYNLEAVFTPQLAVGAEPLKEDVEVDTITDAEIIVDPDKENYEIGTTIDLDVNVPAGWEFAHWSDNVESPQDKTTKIVMDKPQEVTCYLEAVGYELNIQTTGQGTVNIEPEKDYYHLHDMVTLTAESAGNWRFDSWDWENEENKEINIIIDDDINIEAVFGPTLDTYIDGKGTINIEPEQEYYTIGEEVTLSVVPDDIYQFIEWQGNTTSNEKTTTVIMDDYREITAILEILKYNLTADIIRGQGTVEISPQQTTYEYGSKVNIKVTPGTEYEIIEWSGNFEDPESSLNKEEIEIEITDNTIIETKLYKVYSLTVSSWGKGHTLPAEDNYKYREGTEVKLEAVPEDCPFVKWTGDIGDDYYQKELTIIMDQDRTANAIFDSDALGFFQIDPGDKFEVKPGETIEIDISAYFRWGDDDMIEYMVSDLPANAEFDRENLIIKWTPFPED